MLNLERKYGVWEAQKPAWLSAAGQHRCSRNLDCVALMSQTPWKGGQSAPCLVTLFRTVFDCISIFRAQHIFGAGVLTEHGVSDAGWNAAAGGGQPNRESVQRGWRCRRGQPRREPASVVSHSGRCCGRKAAAGEPRGSRHESATALRRPTRLRRAPTAEARGLWACRHNESEPDDKAGGADAAAGDPERDGVQDGLVRSGHEALGHVWISPDEPRDGDETVHAQAVSVRTARNLWLRKGVATFIGFSDVGFAHKQTRGQ